MKVPKKVVIIDDDFSNAHSRTQKVLDEIREELNDKTVLNAMVVLPNGTIDIPKIGGFSFADIDSPFVGVDGRLRVQFNNVQNIYFDYLKLDNAFGFPLKALTVSLGNNNFKNLSSFPFGCQYGDFNLKNNPIESFSGIEKLSITRLYLSSNINAGLLSLLRAKKLGAINCLDRQSPEFDMAIQIINKQLISKDRDILECQEELIDAGLKQYAKL